MKIGIKLISGFLVTILFIVVMQYVILVRTDKIFLSLHTGISKNIDGVSKMSLLEDLADLVRYYDEVLTQSARNYAFTQNTEWKQRYREAEPKLDKTIKKAIELGDEKDKEFFSNVNSANLALVKMEYESIELVDSGRAKEAINILEADTYWHQKNIYKNELENYTQRRMSKYHKTVSESIQSVDSMVKESSLFVKTSKRIILTCSIISLIVVLLTALYITYSISTPLVRLKDVTGKIGRSELDTKIDINTGDEIEDLSNSFNEMVANLKKITVSRDELIKEMAKREKVEEKAKDAAEEWKLTFDSITDLISLHDVDYKIVKANKAFRDTFKTDEWEIIGKACYEIIHGTEEPHPKCPHAKTLESGTTITEELFEPKLGAYLEITTSPVFNEEHKIMGSVHIAKDITRRKKMESVVKESRSMLEEQTARLDQALKDALKSREITISMLEDNNQMREELENKLVELRKAQSNLQAAYAKLKDTQNQLIQSEKMEAIGVMATGVAHEVKNPLGIILQGINNLEDELPSAQKDNHELLKMMKDNVKRADGIIRALLDFARAGELNTKPEDINSVLEDSLILIRHRIKIKDIEIIKELGKGLPKIILDRNKFEQVAVNVFLNAIHAMPNGGKLYIRSFLLELDKLTGRTGNRNTDHFRLGEESVIAEIEDTGSGIPKENIKKIFDPFFTTKGRTEGTGLGLAVSKSIIEMHRGTIDVESECGKGTKFIIALKVAVGEKDGKK